MIKPKNIIVCLLLSVCGFATFAADQNCKALVQYRDSKLLSDLDSGFKKLRMAQDSLQLLNKSQKEVTVLAQKQPTMNRVVQLVLSIKTVNNAIANILKLNPETGLLMEGAGKANKWVAKVLAASSSVGIASAISNSNLEEYLFWESVGDSNQLGKAVKSLHDFTEDIIEQKESYNDGQEIVEGLQEQLNTLNKALAVAQKRVTSSVAAVEAINKFKNEIDRKCN